MNDFTPIDVFERSLKQWWLLVVLIVFGGLVGGVIHFLRPPLYDAQAVVSASIDFSQTGPLDEIAIDYVLENVTALIRSTQVSDRVLAEAQASQIDVNAQGFRKYLERRNQLWVLQIRHPDPRVAADLANIWAEESYWQLDEAVHHAQLAQDLRNHVASLETCLQGVTVTPVHQVPCSIQPFEQLQAEISATSAAIKTEVEASRGISSAVGFDLSERASVPARPSSFGRNSLILAGGLIGFLIGIISISVDLPYRLAKVLHRV